MRQMPLTCNIDAHGKRARLQSGIVMLLVAVVVAILPLGMFGWIIAGVCLVIGGFCIFEARAGWCALRAMGIRTKL
jgi:hypothetical protein